jgi:hypothetical protein
MISLPEEKLIYSEIQKKLFYIIPEKWESIYLYTSIIDVPLGRPKGEMYFYYFPKGIIKKKPVNCYEIPSLFDIDEEEYSKFITDLYNTIKSLRDSLIKRRRKIWSNIVISIENYQFKIEFGYENLNNMPFDSYERHIIWRYQYIDKDIELYPKKDRKIIEKYLEYVRYNGVLKKDMYVEGIYKLPLKNIIDYEKTLTVDEALAQSKAATPKEKRKINFMKKKKPEDIIEIEENETFNNQILNWNNKK